MKQVSVNFFRGSKEDALARIRQSQVDVVINLETETMELIFGGANEEILACRKHGRALYDYSLSGYLPPDPEVVWDIINLIRSQVARGLRVFVHCRKGHERTGFVVAAYRIVAQGWSFEDAYAEMKSEGCHPAWAYLWSGALKEFGDA